MEPPVDAVWRDRARALLDEGPRGPHLSDEAWLTLAEGRPLPGDAGEALEHLSRCAECRDALRAVRLLDRDRRGLDSQPHPPARPTWIGWIAAAAALLVSAGGLWMLTIDRSAPTAVAVVAGSVSRGAPPPPALAPNDPAARLPLTVPAVAIYSPAALTMRGETGTPFAEAFATAMQPWRSGRFAAAAQRLSTVTASHPDLAEGHFYLGVALLLSGRAGEAIAPLERAAVTAPDRLAPEAWWYLAIAYARAGREGEMARALTRACHLGRAQACETAAALVPPAASRP